MKITKTDGPPKEILTFDSLAVENELNLTPDQVEDVAEIFNTPLTGAYLSLIHISEPTRPY